MCSIDLVLCPSCSLNSACMLEYWMHCMLSRPDVVVLIWVPAFACYGWCCTGVDASKKQLLFIAGSTPDARRQVKIPLAAMRDGRLSIRTDLMDAHLYIFHKQTFLKAVQARPSYKSIRQVTSARETSACDQRSPPRVLQAWKTSNTWQLTPTATLINHSTFAWPCLGAYNASFAASFCCT